MGKTVDLYGIPNCDTMKKARRWLESHGVAYVFHDYKVEGADRAKLMAWAKVVGWETLLNRAGTTFRKLSDQARENLDEQKALAGVSEDIARAIRTVVKREAREAKIADLIESNERRIEALEQALKLQK